MMDDLISRQAAIDALDEIRHALWEIDIPSPTVPEYVEHHEQVQSVWKLLDKKQKELYVLPSAQPEQKWIPVSETTLPQEGKVVIAKGKTGIWDFGTYRGHGEDIHYWHWKKNTFKHVYWWMYKDDALPEPYLEEEGE